MNDLRWLGLNWDEGPDVGGEFAPYRQSERIGIYQKYAKKLLEEGKAYFCYCSPAELEIKRKDALAKGLPPRYDNRCRDKSEGERRKLESEGEKPALRFKVEPKLMKVNDLIRGEVLFDTGLLGDIVIMRSDGMPTFIFAVAVDDMLMRITHVLRGEDHLSNTPKQMLLCEALGAAGPEFAHLSMILGPGGERLSKRSDAAGISWYRENGYLPEAVLNYIAMLGWSHPEGREIMQLSEISEAFDFSNISSHAASLDPQKLDWFSGRHIRNCAVERLVDLAIPYLKKEKLIRDEVTDEMRVWLGKAIDAVKDHINCVSGITNYIGIFFGEEVTLTKPAEEAIAKPGAKGVLEAFKEGFKNLDFIDEEKFKALAKSVKGTTGANGPALYQPLRAALCGSLSGPELLKVAPVLGRDVCIARIEKALELKVTGEF